MNKFSYTDKVTQKMARDGAVSKNLTTGATEKISSREPEQNFATHTTSNDIGDAVQTHRTQLRTSTEKRHAPQLHFKASERVKNRNLHIDPMTAAVQIVGDSQNDEVANDRDNPGVEAAYAAGRLAEKSAKPIQRPSAHKQSLRQSEREIIRANAETEYQKAMRSEPSPEISNPIAHYIQKKRYQRKYIRQKWKSQQAGSFTNYLLTQTTRRIKSFASRHSRGGFIIVGIAAAVLLMFGAISSCSIMASSGMNSIVSSSYLSEDEDLLAAESTYCAMETELWQYLNTYEVSHHYDEYHYDLDSIEHDPYVLLSILSALHNGCFTVDEVQDDLAMLFEKQYILTETVTSEIRYRIEMVTWIDADGNVHTEPKQVPYTYYICSVELENFDLSHLPIYIMDEEALSRYAAYMSTLGNREDLFPASKYVYLYITNPPAPYEIPAEYLEDERFATLIAEAEKYLGYPYVWGGYKPSTSFDCSGFVSWVLTNSGLCNTGRLSAQGLYNISTPVSASNVQPGDLVFFKGTYDTPEISHVGIYVGLDTEGHPMFLHCGDPIQYARLDLDYWPYFYAYARPTYN